MPVLSANSLVWPWTSWSSGIKRQYLLNPEINKAEIDDIIINFSLIY